MKTVLIATRELTYKTRRLQAGDQFVADQGDGPLYVTLGLARDSIEKPLNELSLDDYRQQYQMIYGHRCDKRWGIDRIRQEIEKIPGNPS